MIPIAYRRASDFKKKFVVDAMRLDDDITQYVDKLKS